MAISGSRIRQIIREELIRESSGSMSILHPGVTPELYVEAYRRWMGGSKHLEPGLGKEEIGRIVRDRILLSEQEADELTELAWACVGPGDEYPFSYGEVPQKITEAIGWWKIASPTYWNIRHEMHYYFVDQGLDDLRAISIAITPPTTAVGPQARREMISLKGIDAHTLAGRIDFMKLMYAFEEKKALPPGARQKLRTLLLSGAPGVMQAAEIYSML